MWFRCPYPIHFNHVRMPVLAFYCLWIQLQRERESKKVRKERRQVRGQLFLWVSSHKKGEEPERQRPRCSS